MVTILRKIVYDQWTHDVRCLSTDTKPTEHIANGSSCIEMDTAKGYMFDAANKRWIEIPAGSSVVINPARGEVF